MPLLDDPAKLTPQWLAQALRPRFRDVDVASVEVREIREGTNSNARLRVRYNGACPLPESFFLKLPPLDPARREAVNRTGMGRREALFYSTLAERVPMRVPRPYVSLFDDASGAFVLLIEDLEETGCSIPDPLDALSFEQASMAMRDYAALHLRYEDEALRAGEASWVKKMPGGSDYGTTMLQFGLDHHRNRLSNAFAELAELYIARQSAFEAAWDIGGVTVVQGDGHIGNLFEDRGRPGFLDWGLIQLAPPMRDVGYFIAMALSPELRRKHERELIEQYLEARRTAGGSAIALEDAWLQHRVLATYCVPAACQIVLFPENAPAGAARAAAAFLDRAECAIRDLDARAALREVAGV